MIAMVHNLCTTVFAKLSAMSHSAVTHCNVTHCKIIRSVTHVCSCKAKISIFDGGDQSLLLRVGISNLALPRWLQSCAQERPT